MHADARELPPDAAPKPPPKPPEELDEKWEADRLLQTSEMLDWLGDPDRMPDGRVYLTRDGHQCTLTAAVNLLETALARCIEAERTKGDPIGSPACWAVMLARQAHANLHGWEMDEAGVCKPFCLPCVTSCSRNSCSLASSQVGAAGTCK
jgi:hypothetical protein